MSNRVPSLKTALFARSRRFLALFAVVALGLTTIRSEAQAPVVVPGVTNVGQSSAPVAVSVTMSGNGVAASVSAVVQRFTGGDYSLVSAGTCSIGTSYTVGQKCIVSVDFTPKYPGMRVGAVVVEAADGSLLGSTLLRGLANGSLPMLAPGRIDTIAGDAEWIYQSDGALATVSPIFLPQGVVTDAAGNVYLSDSQNNRVRRVDAQTQEMTTVAGTGSPGYSGENVSANGASVSAPSGLVFDGVGNLYFADTGNHIIRRLDAFTGALTTVAGSPGVQGYTGDGSSAKQARLSFPQGIAFDLAGNLLIADTGNNVIRKVDALTGSISTVAGTGTAGPSGDGQPATKAQLNSPWSVTVAQDGSFYISDLSNNRVRQVSLTGIISTVAGTGERGFMGDGGAATAALLGAPVAVAIDPAGNLYIADSGNNRVRKVNASTGTISTIVGTSGEQYQGDGGPADQASLYGPYALYFDAQGYLFIADMFHNRIRKVAALATALNYATMQVGKVSPPQPVVLANNGNANLTLRQPATVNAALDAVTTTCLNEASLAPTDTCIAGAEFAPATIGNQVLGSITLNSDSGFTAPVISLSGQVISVAPTTLTLTSSDNPSLLGTPVTFTAALTNGNKATGTVVFFDGTTQLCSVALAGSSVACNISALTLGSHNITASYSGDANNAPSVSAAVVQVVQQTPALVLTVAPNPVVVTSSITLNLTATAPTGTPGGLIVFYDGGVALSGATLSASGTATFSTAQLTPGSHNLSVQYAGDATNAAAQSNIVSEVVQKAPTVTTLTSNNASVPAGSTVTFTAAVSSGITPSPTGSVQFSDGSTVLGTSALGSNGSAVFSAPSLASGPHAIVAVYSGDTDNATSASSALIEVVQSAGTTTTIASSAASTLVGEPAVFTAAVSGGTGTPTGIAVFHDGAAILGQATLNAQSVATFSTTTLALGGHTITAVYGGDSGFTTSTSAGLAHTIVLATTGLTLAGPGGTVDAGAPFTMTSTLSGSGIAPTGALTLRDGANTIATQNLTASGTVSFASLALAPGTHPIVAVYAGDADNSAATSAAVTLVVNLAPTTTALSSSAIKAAIGQNVTFTATIGSDSPNASGSVQFVDGASTLGSSVVGANGTATLSTSTLTYGLHTIKAIYSGDSEHAASTSVVLNEQIVEGATESLTSSINPSSSGQGVVFTARINGVGTQPATGAVSFSDGGTLLGTTTLDSSGTANLQSAALAVGSHTITANYAGDSNYAPLSATMVQIVQSDGTQTSLSASANPAIYGTPLTLIAAVTTNGGIATGTVTFSDGSAALGSSTLGANGVATLTLSTLATGSHTLVATYAGTSSASASTSTPLILTVHQLTQVALSSNSNPALTLSPIQLSATMSNSGGGQTTGTVTFTDGGAALGTVTLDPNGHALLNLASLSAGNHSLQVTYNGDGGNFASTSPTLIETVQLRPSSVALTATPTNPNNPQQVTLIAVVHWTGPVTPTGSVIFTSSGGVVLGSSPVDSVGVATVTIILPSTASTITASYGGDANYAASSSLLTTISGGAATQFTMLVNPTSVSVQSKQHTTVTIALASIQGFADTMQLGCLGLPFAATCTFSSPQAKLAANGTATVQLTIDTGDPLGAGGVASVHNGPSNGILLCFLPFGIFLGYGLWRGKRTRLIPLLLLIGAAVTTLSAVGCAGLQINGTPAGAYTFKVTAAGTGTGATQSQTMNLTVTQ